MKKDKDKTSSAEAIDLRLDLIEKNLDTLRSLYDQHFAGVLKRQPQKEHDEFKRLLSKIAPHDLRTTASRFRFQTLKTRHIQLNNLWTKILKEIEEGTYRRDLFLLKAKEASSPNQKASEPSKIATPVLSSKSPSKHLELAYEKFAQLAQAQNQRVPSKEAFIKAIDAQIADVKKRDPNVKIEIKIQKDAQGKVALKLKTAKT